METDNLVIATGAEMGRQNGVHEKRPTSGEKDGILDGRIGTVGTNGSPEIVAQLEESGTFNSSTGEIREGTIVHDEISGFTISKESRVKDTEHTNHSKPQKGQGKNKTAGPKHVEAAWVKKNKDGNVEAVSTVLNGSVTSTSRSKQPFALATNRTFNDRQVAEINAGFDSSRPTKLTSAPSAAWHSQQTGKSCSASSITNVTQSEGLKEQTKHLKPLKQGPSSKVEENMPSASLSPTAGGTKPRKAGTLPSYSFSFKCDERAEKRKAFYSKLEEKVHAKEAEKTTLQEKSKETQEAEIKMLRKSLTFKAIPMPSFYQEPAPPKLELKKIPPTRAKSPKFGRQKSSTVAHSEGTSGHSSRLGRLSLDEKVPQDGITKGSPLHPKKPFRKSLPKLPSEKSSMANATDDATSPQQSENHELKQEVGLTAEPSQTQSRVSDGPVSEDQVQPSLEQEPMSELVTSEHLTEEH
ncbi:hypothetical protein HHK36_021451 [Tetracentron sinense]|uniref:TPX2 C-terminal domain-containing protein n=1 Tax=Tetracentron sinense TaxID=13715 RepID=A0A834YTR6_TETSI|nr:hypothetical protein HHK36_021451 [Tetracentron sinense]